MRFLGAGGKMGFGRGYPYATGGDYVYLYEDTTTGKTYRVHEFLSTGTSTLNVEVGGQMEYLIVGGGGGGGVPQYDPGGGGGAGGATFGNLNTSKQSYSIVVGKGGTGGTNTSGAFNGDDSSFSGITAFGGGRGADRARFAGNGGCGGGGCRSTTTAGLGTPGQGFNGGTGSLGTNTQTAAGGGGAGQEGFSNFNTSVAIGVSGGNGIEWPPNSGNYYGGGAGSAGSSSGGNGGLGGGGRGGFSLGTYSGKHGENGKGGGGGGGHRYFDDSSRVGGNGGSGIVIVRYVVGEESYDIEEGQSLGTPTATQSSAGTWSLGEISNQDLVLAFDAIFPSTPAQGCLAEKGGTTLGFWCGLKSSGTYFRVRAGGGGSAPASNITLLDIYDFPADDQLHTVVVEINVGTGMTMRVWIDGVYKGSATSTATSAAGTGSGVFLSGGANVNITGEPTAAWPGGTAQGEARFYSNTLIS